MSVFTRNLTFLSVLAVGLPGFAQVPDIRQPLDKNVAYSVQMRPSGPEQVVSVVRFTSKVLSGVHPNNTVEAFVYRPRDAIRPMPVALILHYFGATSLRFERRMADELNRRGIAAVVMTLPYHLSRARSIEQSGIEALQPDPQFLARTLAQAILDARMTIDYIETQPDLDSSRIACVGTSLGGILASTLYAVDRRVKHNVALLAGGDIAHIIWTSSVTARLRQALQSRSVTLDDMYEALRGVDPLTYAQPELGASMLVVRARYDEVILPEDTDKLIRAFGEPKTVELPTGHYGGVVFESRLYRLVGDFLSAEFRGLLFDPPARIPGPTIRLGLHYNPYTELTLVAGLDIYRVGAKPGVVVTAFLSTEGVIMYLGIPLKYGFSVGGAVTREGIGWGVSWTFVL